MTNPPTRQHDTLEREAIGAAGVVTQSLAHVGPALGFIFGLQIITGFAGPAAPVAFLAALVVMLLLAVGTTQLARHLPSAGGYITYVERGVSPRAGLLTAWLSVLYEPVIAALNLALLGGILELTLEAEFGFMLPWWTTVLVGAAVLAVLGVLGIRVSMKVALAFAAFEVVLCLVLAVAGLVDPGPGGRSLAPFDPGSAPSSEGLYLAVVFAIFGYAGFESVAPLAEESRNPRRTLPRAMFISLIISGGFLVLASWGALVGWGTSDAVGFAGDPAPVFTLAQRLLGDAWVLLLLALVNGVVAVSLAGQNAATRMVFAAARAGTLPAALATLHPRHRTPVNALLLQGVVTLLLGLGGGALLGPLDLVVFLALSVTLVAITIYVLGNVAVWKLYRGEHTAEFRWHLHVLCPVLSSAALLWVAYKSVNPLPDGPARYAPLLAGVWLLAGLVIVATRRRPAAAAIPAIGVAEPTS